MRRHRLRPSHRRAANRHAAPRHFEQPGGFRHLRRIVPVALLASLLVIPGLFPAAAQSGGGDPRARRAEIQRERAEIAAQLDVLLATDEELEAAYRTLTESVRLQEARVADAQRAVDDAEQTAARLRAEADAVQREVDALRLRVRERAIAAYVNPAGSSDVTDVLLRDDDINEAERRKALVEQVTSRDLDAVEAYRAAKDRLARLHEQADAAAAQAAALRDELGAELAQLEADRAEKAKAKAELESRIAGFQAHISSLAAEEASIEAIIRAAEAPPVVVASAPAAGAGGDAAAGGSTPGTGTPGSGGGGSTGGGSTGGGSSGGGSSGGGGGGGTAPAPAPAPGGGGFGWPCAGGVNSPFGPRWGGFHSGIDIGCANGAPVSASKGGTVIFTGFNGGYGNLVLIDHGGGFVTAYAHLSSIAVSNGQSVGGGTYLGAVGCTGSCTGPHLHFEIRVGGSAVNPMSYF